MSRDDLQHSSHLGVIAALFLPLELLDENGPRGYRDFYLNGHESELLEHDEAPLKLDDTICTSFAKYQRVQVC